VLCPQCDAFERQLRGLEIELEQETDKRDSGFGSSKDGEVFQRMFEEKLALFHQTKVIYDNHKRLSHG
jgi:tRNA 2-selenouridine synthase SelU